MDSKKIRDGLTIGFALFAMFFGAGNLILPPFLGLNAGADWWASISGFTLTAILAPFLGILAVLFSGESFTDLGARINKKLAVVLAMLIMLSIGPMVAIPRTAATTFEVGVLSIFPDFNPIYSSILFFIIVLVLSISPSRVVNIIGQYLTPLLLVLLTVLVVAGIVNPLDTSLLEIHSNEEAFFHGFAEGYQTMDVLASVIFASIIITAAISKGYTSTQEKTKITIMAGLVAMFCLLFIYGGLVYLGATSGYPIGEQVKRTDLLLYISSGLLGTTGTYALALCIALACLTTAIALTCAVGTFFSELTRGFLSYRLVVILTCVVSGYLAVNGVDEIIAYAFPFLAFIYPITLTLVLYMVAFGRVVKRKAPFVAAIFASFIIATLELIAHISSVFAQKVTDPTGWITVQSKIQTLISSIPLYEYNLPWLLPSAICFLIALSITGTLSKKTA